MSICLRAIDWHTWSHTPIHSDGNSPRQTSHNLSYNLNSIWTIDRYCHIRPLSYLKIYCTASRCGLSMLQQTHAANRLNITSLERRPFSQKVSRVNPPRSSRWTDSVQRIPRSCFSLGIPCSPAHEFTAESVVCSLDDRPSRKHRHKCASEQPLPGILDGWG